VSAPATPETAKVYRSTTGRRFFTRKAALRSSAWALIRKHCECDKGDRVTPEFFCRYHWEGDERTALCYTLVERLVRLWARRKGGPL
jgi:hypothetical protein